MRKYEKAQTVMQADERTAQSGRKIYIRETFI